MASGRQATTHVDNEVFTVKWTARNVADGDRTDLWRVQSDGLTVDVRVPPGLDLVARLDLAIARALDVPTPRPPEPPLWRIEESDYSHGDIFELERDTIWTVVDAVSNTPRWEFRGGTSHVLEAGQWSEATGSHGVDEVVLAADGRHILVRSGDEVECQPLPDS